MFPDTDIELTAQAAFGADLTAAPDTWEWTDLTCEHPLFPGETIPRLLNTPITINRGVTVGAGTPRTTTGTVHLLNHDGALTPGLPTSPYWPHVDTGTPVRLRARTQTDLVDTFTRSAVANGWGVATSGETWTPVSSASAFATTGTQATITFAAVNTTNRISTPRTFRDIDVVFDVAVNAVATGAAHSVGPSIRYSGSNLYRYWCTVEFGLAGAIALRVRRYFNSAGTATTVANTTVGALTYSGSTMIRCRVQVIGTSIRMRAWLPANPEPSTWTVDITDTLITGRNAALAANDVLHMQATVFSGATNVPPIVFTLDNITAGQAYSDRLEGYITDVRPVFLPQPDGTTWSTVMVDVGGIGSRLEKNESPSYSPLRRSVQLAATPPIAYWPLEDAEGSTSAASAYPGHQRAVTAGPVVFSFDAGITDDVFQSRYGSKPMASVAAGASLAAVVPRSTVKTEWAITCAAQLYVPESTLGEIRIMQWVTDGGTHARWALVGVATGYEVRAYNETAGTTTVVTSDAFGVYTGLLSFTVEAIQNGGNIDATILYNDVAFSSGSVAGTLAAVSKVTVNPDRANTTAAVTVRGLRFIVGHVRVSDETSLKDLPYYADPDSGVVVFAGNAWYLESVHGRLGRLCDEERVPCTILGDPGTTGLTRVNTQRDGGFVDLITQAAESESGGLLYERGFGYYYLPRSSRYNQAVSLTVDLSTYRRSSDTDPGDILVPQLDARTTNVWTVQRNNGAEGSYAAPAAFRALRGTIAEQAVLDVLYDTDTDDHASWRVHLGVDGGGQNYPSVPIDLAANPDLIDDWLSCDMGHRIQRTNQPTIAGLDTIDQVIEGITETLGPRVWTVAINAGPASVWQVAAYDDAAARYDSGSTTVGADVSDSATSLVFSTVNSGDLWSTTSEPYDVLIAGEQITVTSMAAATGSGPYSQTATVTRAVNGVVKEQTATTEIHIATPGRFAL